MLFPHDPIMYILIMATLVVIASILNLEIKDIGIVWSPKYLSCIYEYEHNILYNFAILASIME